MNKNHKYTFRDGQLIDITNDKPTATELINKISPDELPFRLVPDIPHDIQIAMYIRDLSYFFTISFRLKQSAFGAELFGMCHKYIQDRLQSENDKKQQKESDE